LCELRRDFEEYFMRLEASARGNYRKALRLGYEFKRFDYNSRLEDIREIWQSTPVRQGTLPREMREGRVRTISDPPSRCRYHDYPYLGIFKNEKLTAYAGCMIFGELCNLNDIYGHTKYQNDGIVRCSSWKSRVKSLNRILRSSTSLMGLISARPHPCAVLKGSSNFTLIA